MSSQVTVASQSTLNLLKSDGPNNLYGGIKPSEIDTYNKYPHSAKLSHNRPTLGVRKYYGSCWSQTWTWTSDGSIALWLRNCLYWLTLPCPSPCRECSGYLQNVAIKEILIFLALHFLDLLSAVPWFLELVVSVFAAWISGHKKTFICRIEKKTQTFSIIPSPFSKYFLLHFVYPSLIIFFHFTTFTLHIVIITKRENLNWF